MNIGIGEKKTCPSFSFVPSRDLIFVKGRLCCGLRPKSPQQPLGRNQRLPHQVSTRRLQRLKGSCIRSVVLLSASCIILLCISRYPSQQCHSHPNASLIFFWWFQCPWDLSDYSILRMQIFKVFRQKYDMLSREFVLLQPPLWCTRSFNVKTNRSRLFIVWRSETVIQGSTACNSHAGCRHSHFCLLDGMCKCIARFYLPFLSAYHVDFHCKIYWYDSGSNL